MSDVARFVELVRQGLEANRRGDALLALTSYDRALALQPRSADALFNRGNALLALGRYPEALASYEKALELRSDDAEALNNRGNALRALGRHAEAVASYEHALRIVPAYAKALGNRGTALLALERAHEALDSFRQAYTASQDAPWMIGIAHALHALERNEEALEAYERALAVNPSAVAALGGRGNVLQALNRHEEALSAYQHALAIDPKDAETHWNEALVRLTLGDYRRGWEKYEWRWDNPALRSPRRHSDKPLWMGERDIAGQTILLHAEQGYGDAIQAIRYAPLVAASGGRVIVHCRVALSGLFRSVQGVAQVVTDEDPLPPFDCHTPLMSLPLAFRTTLETIPASVPYVAAPQPRVHAWRTRLARHGGKPKVGLAWRGNPDFSRVHAKSCPVERLLPLMREDCTFFSLQTGDAGADAARLGLIADHIGELQTFDDTAALVQALDLVITVDTAVAHLAGALARPVWIMLPFSADWRWLRGREDSPWYSSACLVRLPRASDWDSVVAAVRQRLRDHCVGKEKTDG